MSLPSLDLVRSQTALVLVDIQNFTVAMDTQPHTGRQVLERAAAVAAACRRKGVQVVLVRVESGPGNVLSLTPRLDAEPTPWTLPAGAHDFPSELAVDPSDVVVTKYNWGGFHGTDLDIQLRRRGITTLLTGGLVTNIGLDTTMRQAHERGYDQVVMTDVCGAFSQGDHDYSLKSIFPRIARMRTSAEVLHELESA